MSETYRPETNDQLRDLIAWALAEETPLALSGRGTKQTYGRPMQTGGTIDLSALSGILLYEPEELIVKARTGTPLAEIEAAVAEQDQLLAFEPPDLGPLLGGEAGRGSIGGALACNLSGPRRIKAGAARDHFLGAEAVSGRGEVFKSGGRVVKNVTGYDLCKVLAGSFGTLAAMTEVTVKVLPAPEKTRTVLIYGLDAAGAVAAMTAALSSSHEVSGASYLPDDLARWSAVDYVESEGKSVTALRIEGPAASVEERTEALRALLESHGPTEKLHSDNSATFWAEVRDVKPYWEATQAVWRISVPPAAGAAIARAIEAATGARIYMDWGGGLLWAAVDGGGDAGAAAIRQAVARGGGGHATLVRGSEALRASVPVFHPQEAALAALGQRLKESFDPKGILNPGRMAAAG